jgi:hypothetical protein
MELGLILIIISAHGHGVPRFPCLPLSSHLATLFSQIIEQETSFLVELNTFQSMLQQAEIISTTIKSIVDKTKTLAKRSVIRTDNSFFNEQSVFFVDTPSKHPVSATNQNSDFQK